MAPWEKILCCSELKYLPPNPRQECVPPTIASVQHLDFIVHEGDEYAWKYDPRTPLIPKEYKDHEGIISVARFGDTSDSHLPVRYFAAWTEEDGTLGGFVEVSTEKVETADIQRKLGGFNNPKYDRYYGECPNHPNLEFYVRFHALEEKSIFSWEKNPKEKDKSYPWEEEAIVPEVSTEKAKTCGDFDFDFDSNDCPLPFMYQLPTGIRTTTDWRPIEAEDECITKFDFDSWPTMVW